MTRHTSGSILPRWLRVAFGITLLAVLVVAFDPSTLSTVLRSVDIGWLLLVAVIIAGVALLGAVNLYLFLQTEHYKLRFTEFLLLYWTSWAIGLVVPGQVGDIASVAALLHRRGHDWKVVLARSILDKLISLIVMVVVAAFAILPLIRGDSWRMEPLLVLIMALLLLAGAGWLSAKYLMAKRYPYLEAIAELFAELAAAIRQLPELVLVNVVLSFLKTFMMGVAYWAMFMALGVATIDILSLVPLVAAISLVAYVPVSFNGLGTVEAAGVALFAGLGVTAPIVLAAFIALRLVVLALAWLPAGIWILASRK